MDTEKKKMAKPTKIVIVVVSVLLLLFIIGMFAEDGDESASSDTMETTKAVETVEVIEAVQSTEENGSLFQTEETKDRAGAETSKQETESEKTVDDRYRIGETVTFGTDSGGLLKVTLTDWGSTFDGFDETVLYVEYIVENIGKENVRIGPGMFEVYADDYSIGSAFVLDGDEGHYVNLSPGRKTAGTFYVGIDPEDASVIEVEHGDAIFVIKDDSMDAMPDENIRDNVNIPSDMQSDAEPIDKHELSGYYGGMMGQSTLSISIYSSQEENEMGIGNAEIYVEGGQYSYNGQIFELATNSYKVESDSGDEVLLAATKWEDTVIMQLYVNGQFVEEYLMMGQNEP